MENITSFDSAPLCITCQCDLGSQKRHILFEDKRYCMVCIENLIASLPPMERYMEVCENLDYKG